MSELTDKFLVLEAHIKSATAHFGASTHEEKQRISHEVAVALAGRMREILLFMERVKAPAPADPNFGAPAGDPPLTDPPSDPPSAPAPPPAGIIRG
jgi:hypothetical protein